jgi:hypothetical protein
MVSPSSSFSYLGDRGVIVIAYSFNIFRSKVLSVACKVAAQKLQVWEQFLKEESAVVKKNGDYGKVWG